jgi:predicted lipid carrier protein YhbT
VGRHFHLSRRPFPAAVESAGPETPDLSFSANLSAFLQLLARQEDPDTLFFNRELSIVGDTELGLVIKNMLDAVELPQLPSLPIFRP